MTVEVQKKKKKSALPGERESAVVPRKRLRKILQEKEPERRVKVILHLGVRLPFIDRVFQVRPALGVRPARVADSPENTQSYVFGAGREGTVQ